MDSVEQPEQTASAPSSRTGKSTRLGIHGVVLLLWFLTVAIVLVLLTVNSSSDDTLLGPFRGPTEVVFFLLSIVLFFALWLRTRWQIEVWRAVLDETRRHVPPTARILPRGAMERLAAGCREAAKRAIAPWPKWLVHGSAEPFAARADELHGILEAHKGKPDTIARALERLSPSLGELHSLRAVDQFLGGALLFIGIIGTFYGLMGVLLNDDLLRFLGAASQADRLSSLDPKLKGVLVGLGTAFSSSLFAYCSYLFGRLLSDLCDEEYEAATREFVRHVHGRLALLFPHSGLIGHVDLPAETTAQLVGNVTALQEATKSAANLVQETRATANALSQAAGSMLGTVQAMTGIAETIAARTETATRAWTAAAEGWSTATGDFIAAAGPLTAEFRAAAERVSSYEKTLLNHVEGMFRDVRAATEEHGKALTAQAETIGHRVNGAAAQMSGSLESLAQTFKNSTGTFAEIQKLHADIAGQTEAGRKLLLEGIERLMQQAQGTQVQTLDVARRLEAGDKERSDALLRALKAMESRLEAQRRQLEDVRLAIVGGGPPTDLVTVLKDLRDALRMDGGLPPYPGMTDGRMAVAGAPR